MNSETDNNEIYEEAVRSFIKKYDNAALESELNSFSNLVKQTLENSNIEKFKISSRIKEQTGCLRKFDEKYKEKWEASNRKNSIVSFISDLRGIRVICLYDDEIRTIADLLKTSFFCDPNFGETDKTSATKSDDSKFGYLGIHLDLKLGPTLSKDISHSHLKDIPFEVQIRSISQDAWSEVDHGLKYKKENLPTNIRRRVNRLAALYELADQEFIAIRDSIEAAEKNVKAATFNETAALLDVITLGYLVRVIFDDEPLSKFHSTSILEEINKFDSTMTVLEFRKVIEDNLPQVKKYINTFQGTDWKTATIIRYCLYTHNSVNFGNLLQNFQTKKYDPWRLQNLQF